MSKILIYARVWLSRLSNYRLLLLLVGSVLLFTFYLSISRIVVYNSDDASIVLEAQAMLRGNLILRGWYVPTDNFITIDIPLYALGLLLGFSPSALLHVVPAFLYTLAVMLGGSLTWQLLGAQERVWGVLACLALVAFPPLDMVQRLMIGPIHIGTICLIFLGFFAYKHFLGGKSGRRTALALLLLIIVLATVGDPFALVLFVLPLLVAEGIPLVGAKVREWMGKSKSGGTELSFASIPPPRRDRASPLSFLSPLPSLLLLVIALSFALRGLLELVGVYNLVTAGFVPTDLPGMVSNFMNALVFFYNIFHANIFTTGAFSLANFPLFINALAVSALIYALIRWSWRSLWQPDTESAKIISVFVWGFIGLLAAFTLSTLGGGTGMRYLYPLLFFGGVIGFAVCLPFGKRRLLIAGTLLVLVMNAGLFASSLLQAPTPTATGTQLITFLEAHHLTHGLGTYWVAPIVTVQSEGQVIVRQVATDNHQIQPDGFLADEKWFAESDLRDANFVVYRDKDSPQVCYDASLRSFGVPEHTYTVDIYTVLVWDKPLLTHMQPGYKFNGG